MTYPSAEPDLSAVCPYLGLADDADSHATYATEAHRCYRMPSPTRIAQGHQETYCLVANHVTCPIYTGEGISKVAAPAAAAAAAAPPPAAQPAASVPGPAPEARQAAQKPRPAPAGPRPRRPGGSDGQMRPRPRPGGISMPAATIGLFALAIVLIAIAFLINQAVDDDGTQALSEADAFATRNANRTAQAANTTLGTSQTQQTSSTTPGSGTPGTQTATTQTPSATRTATGGADTYTVKSGDLCGTIAEEHGITLQQLLDANNMKEADCNNLQVGQVLRLK